MLCFCHGLNGEIINNKRSPPNVLSLDVQLYEDKVVSKRVNFCDVYLAMVQFLPEHQVEPYVLGMQILREIFACTGRIN